MNIKKLFAVLLLGLGLVACGKKQYLSNELPQAKQLQCLDTAKKASDCKTK